MKLKTAEYILAAICGLMAVSFLAVSYTGNLLFGCFGVAFLVIAAVWLFLFIRCPACGKYLGRYGKYCGHCGEKIDKEDRIF